MDLFLETFFNWQIVGEAWPILWQGLKATLLLSLLVVPLGVVGGVLIAVLSTFDSPWIKWPLRAWVDVFRALPPLVLLIFVFAGLPFIGVDVGAWGAVAIGFFLNTGAYYGEILRAGIESVPRGQMEAARSTGLNRAQALAHVVLPQAVRNVLPALGNDLIALLKDTSLVSVLGVREITQVSRLSVSTTFRYEETYFILTLFYLSMTLVLSLLLQWFQRRVGKNV